VLLQPGHQLGDLVNAGDGAAGELGNLLVDLRCGRLCNPASSFSKSTINTEAASIDLVAQLPQ